MRINKKKEIVKALLKFGAKCETEFLEQEKDSAKQALKYPMLFVFCCIADTNRTAASAWHWYEKFLKEGIKNTRDYTNNKHNILKIMYPNSLRPDEESKLSKSFDAAVTKINKKYNGKAEKIWKEASSYADLTSRLLEFKGIGIKVANMAANILRRYHRINFPHKGLSPIDIAPDIHVKRMLEKLALIPKDAPEHIELICIYTARDLNPSAPYKLDLPCFYIEKELCPDKCNKCPVKKYCSESKK